MEVAHVEVRLVQRVHAVRRFHRHPVSGPDNERANDRAERLRPAACDYILC